MNQNTQRDINLALEQNRGVICIQIAVRVISPHGDDFVYETNPCIANSLIEMGWNKI